VTEEYNPLDYENLTRNLARELLRRGPFRLPLEQAFSGSGVYALFYSGDFELYQPVRSPDAAFPIYVGKAVPEGARKGKRSRRPGTALFRRICEHVDSINQAGNLNIEDFQCRFLVVTPLWISMAERFLLEYFQPNWNVCLEGFGLHDPGKGRHQGEIPWWDVLHPGRSWAHRLRQTRSEEEVIVRLQRFLAENPPRRGELP
jgi:hypothetical protein